MITPRKLLLTALACVMAGSAAAYNFAKSPLNARWRFVDKPTLTIAYNAKNAGLPDDILREVLERVATSWSEIDCGVTLKPLALGDGAKADIELRLYGPKTVWKRNKSFAAHTEHFGDEVKGHVERAVISFNPAYPLDTQAPFPNGALDFESLVLHEVGHALGLAHPTMQKRPVMSAGVQPQRIRRTLLVDDKKGLCAIYKP